MNYLQTQTFQTIATKSAALLFIPVSLAADTPPKANGHGYLATNGAEEYAANPEYRFEYDGKSRCLPRKKLAKQLF
ncbi:hypothetical protein [Brucella tritici]|uniref:hypothetical protein n=1 Tax=Brucella tritici TaxID=94626 RepID=UPI0015918AFA|nr:hypothetical protein [Brucella tritici]